MRHLTPASWRLSAAVLFCLASAFAQDVTLKLKNAGNPPYDFAGVYTSPYTLTDITNPSNAFDISAFCTTFSRDVYPNQEWEAQVTTLDNYSGGINYAAMAYLAFQILDESDSRIRALLSFALWGVSEEAAVIDWLQEYNVSHPGYVTAADFAYIDARINEAKSGPYNFDPANVSIYTPTNCLPGGGECGTSPQYFISVKTPEPSALTLLGFDLVALVAVVGLVFRGRKSMSFGLFVSPKGGN